MGLGYHAVVHDLNGRDAAVTDEDSPKEPEILLVDPWAAVHPEYRRALARFNSTAQPWIRLMIPWSIKDEETASAKTMLRDSIEELFKTKLAMGTPDGEGTTRRAVPGRIQRGTAADSVRGCPALPQARRPVPSRRNADEETPAAPPAINSGPTAPHAPSRPAEPGSSPMTDGKIVTFYSYKGGTGRTMALANTAWILASNGNKVLVVDWDLESPGLHKYYQPFLDSATIAVRPVSSISSVTSHGRLRPR